MARVDSRSIPAGPGGYAVRRTGGRPVRGRELRSARVCRFAVTVAHADEGWKHYADRWDVLAEDGAVLATRILRHPHVEEQPFRRSLGGIRVPRDASRMRVRAHDSLHGFGGQEVDVELPPAGPPDSSEEGDPSR